MKVTKDDFFGPLVKNYVFNLVPDTTLASPDASTAASASFKPGVLSYNALMAAGADAVARSTPAPPTPPPRSSSSRRERHRTATVTVSNGAPRRSTPSTSTPRSPAATSSAPPNSVRNGSACARTTASGALADGSLVITSQAGDLQGTAEHREEPRAAGRQRRLDGGVQVVFARPLANNNEQGGIVAYADDDNYVKLAWEMGASTAAINKLRVVVLREQNGTATTLQVTGADAQQHRRRRRRDLAAADQDRQHVQGVLLDRRERWRFIGATTLNVEATQAGLVAFNRAGTSTDLDVAFDYFRIESQGDPVPVVRWTPTARSAARCRRRCR